MYRASEDGWKVEEFHKRCDNKGATLILAKSKFGDKVFGGYTKIPWTSADHQYFADPDSFLFSLTNK